MDLGLTDRVFVVTAASSGLGYATAEQLVAEGARVLLVGRRAELLAERQEALGADKADYLVADLSDADVPRQACEQALKTFGRLDGAMISVGGPPPGSALENTDEQWFAAFNSVFLPAVRTVRAIAELGTADDAAVGLVLSTSAKQPMPGLTISNGLRPGLATLVKQYGTELGPRGTRVFGLLPGKINTDRMNSLLTGNPDPEKAKADAIAEIPLGRLGRPEEFGRIAAFALSPAASYLNGCVVPVDGGLLHAL